MNQPKKTELRLVSLEEIKPWERNPRLNDEAVPMVEKSIRAHGYLDFIETDEKLNILAGHTRLKALQSIAQNGGLGKIKNIVDGKFPVLVHFGIRNKDAYRLANNKTGEIAEWDMPALKDILTELDTGEIDMDITGFSTEDIEQLMTSMMPDDTYTQKIITPVYEPKGERPPVADLFNREKTSQLIAEIDAAKLPADVAEFLKLAAERHTAFHFRRIAEFYCHADAKIQDLMEKSGLVIIDFKKAIEYGFVHLTEQLGKLADLEEADNADA